MTDLCMMCGKPQPEAGWHTVGCCDGDAEFFCSSECFNSNCDYLRDDEEDEYDPGEECGRWSNGNLLSYYHCRQAGTEFCDWECPYSRTDPVGNAREP